MKESHEHSSWRAISASLLGAVMAGTGALFFIFADRGATTFSAWLWQFAPWAVFLLMPFGLLLILWLRDHVFPWTDGTGIPQTIAALEKGPGELRDRLFSPRVAAGKAILTALGLFSLFSIGREGPSVQLGACFMHWAGRWARFPVHLAERGLIMAGGAAGIAAAFNTPIAGLVFAFEEIGRRFDKRNLGIIVRSVMVACLVCLVFVGNYYSFGQVDFGRNLPLEFLSPGPWVAVLIIGAVGGLLGGMFAKVLLLLAPRVTRLMRTQFVPAALVIGLACAALAWFSNGATLGTGHNAARALVLQGSPDYLATLPAEEVAALQSTRENLGPWYALQRAAASMLVLLTGIPGGLFDPSFSIGAGLGQATADWFAWSGASLQGLILLWIVAYFSGVVQSPLTSFIIVVEMTGAISFTLPLGLASVVAYEISRRICEVPLYEALAQNFLRVVPPEQRHLRAAENHG
jgi:H+/Cl- antiporter ClcA